MKSPKAPDPYATANAQTQSNNQAAWYNAIIGNANENNPYGSLTYAQSGQVPIIGANGQVTGYAPQFTRNVTLNPEQQHLLDLQNKTMGNIGELGVSQSERMKEILKDPATANGLQAWANYSAAPKLSSAFRQDTAPTDRQAIESAIMQSYHRNADPQARAQDVQLAAQGMSAGTPGYGTVQQGREDSAGEATRQAYLASGAESRAAQGAYNEAEQLKNAITQQNWSNTYVTSDAQNKLRGAQLAERLGLRNQNISEILSLLGGSGPTTPSFSAYNAPSTQAAPIGQYIYDKYNADSQAAAARNQGMFGLGSAALGLLTAPIGGVGSLFGGTLLGSLMGR